MLAACRVALTLGTTHARIVSANCSCWFAMALEDFCVRRVGNPDYSNSKR